MKDPEKRQEIADRVAEEIGCQIERFQAHGTKQDERVYRDESVFREGDCSGLGRICAVCGRYCRLAGTGLIYIRSLHRGVILPVDNVGKIVKKPTIDMFAMRRARL
mgnify:CR=1 FL=1